MKEQEQMGAADAASPSDMTLEERARRMHVIASNLGLTEWEMLGELRAAYARGLDEGVREVANHFFLKGEFGTAAAVRALGSVATEAQPPSSPAPEVT